MAFILHVGKYNFTVISVVVLKSQTHENLREMFILFFHFLMMWSTLFSLSCFYEGCHGFEDSISSSEMLVKKVLMMELKEPMVSFVFIWRPMTAFFVWIWVFNGFGFSGFGLFSKSDITQGKLDFGIDWMNRWAEFNRQILRLNVWSVDLSFLLLWSTKHISIVLISIKA